MIISTDTQRSLCVLLGEDVCLCVSVCVCVCWGGGFTHDVVFVRFQPFQVENNQNLVAHKVTHYWFGYQGLRKRAVCVYVCVCVRVCVCERERVMSWGDNGVRTVCLRF